MGQGTRVSDLRLCVIWAIRGVATLLLTAGAYLCLKRVVMGFLNGRIAYAYAIWVETGESNSFYRGCAMLLVGAMLAVLALPIARWIVTPRRGECPGCGYAGAEDSPSGQCSECGLAQGKRPTE